MRDATRDGLAWEDNGLGPEPRWTREPDVGAVKRVCRRQLGIADDAPDDVLKATFLADGTFNKLYGIRSILHGQLVMRVSLPVDPRHKTRGEAAALQLVRRKTDIPVPRVVAFDDSRSNAIGYEWLLMERMPGTPAYYRWRKMTMAQKESLTVRLADFQAQLLRCGNRDGGDGFRGIGTLGSDQNTGTAPEPGPIVSSFFFSGDRYHYPISRGPFRSSHDWLQAQLNVIIKEHTTALAAARNDDDREYAETALRVARKLQRILHKIFPAIVHPPERTVVWHDDLSLRNIMVDNNGSVTAVIGWYVSHTISILCGLKCSLLLGNAYRRCRAGWPRRCQNSYGARPGRSSRTATATRTWTTAAPLRTTPTTASTTRARRSCTGST
jgi:aminoglycoside phosphotransferase (APT) family kinase protein